MAHNVKQRLMHETQYAALRSVAMAMHAFDVERNLATARAMGTTMYLMDRKHRKRAQQNIRRSLPHLTEPQIRTCSLQSMQHFIQLAIEVQFTTRLIRIETWTRYAKLNQLDEAVDLLLSDRPVIMLTGHFGNWELLGYLLATLGFDLEAVARPMDNPRVNRWLTEIRERRGLRLITKFGATSRMVNVLERGGTLAFIADQNAGDKGLFVPFFGRLASTYKSIGLLAMQFQTPIICGYAIRRHKQFHFDIGATDIIYPEDWADQPDPLYYITARYMRAIESMVRLAPHQYLWIHRRWKSRPRHERMKKAMPDTLEQKLRALPWIDDHAIEQLKITMHR